MNYLGDFIEDATVTFTFTTNAADGGRESLSASLEEADISIYKDSNSTAMTLTASTITVSANPGSQVGVYLVSIDMSNDTDFTTGSDYSAVLYPSDETVDSQSIAGEIACWSCENRTTQVRSINDATITARSFAADALAANVWASATSTELINALVSRMTTDPTQFRTNVVEWQGNTVNTSSGQPDVNTRVIANNAITAASIAVSALNGKGDWTTTSDIITPLASGTAQSATSDLVTLAASENFANNILNGNIINITGGTGAGQSRVIIDSFSANDTVQVIPTWTTNPSSDSTYEILQGSVNVVTVSGVGEDIATETKQNTAQADLDIITGPAGIVLADATITAAKFGPDALAANAWASATTTEIIDALASRMNTDPTEFRVNVMEWTGNTVNTSGGQPDVNTRTIANNAITNGVIAEAAIGAANFIADAIAANVLSAAASTEIVNAIRSAMTSDPTGFRVNITEWSGNTVSTNSGLPKVNANTISNNAITAASIAVSALNGKGDWNTTTPPSAISIINEFETQSAADPTGFRVNVVEWQGNTVNNSEGYPNVIAKAISNGVVNSASIAVSALNGKGDWNTTTPPSAASIINEFETQSTADPTGFRVNVVEWSGNTVSTNSGLPKVNANTISNNAIIASTIAANALDGKGDWATAAGSGLTALASGTAQSGASDLITLAALSNFADDILNGNVIKIHTGTGAGQSRLIIDSWNANDTVQVIPAWTTNPSSDSEYEIVDGPVNVVAVSGIAEDLATETQATANKNVIIANANTRFASANVRIANVETQIGIAGDGLTNLGGMSNEMKVEVRKEANTAIQEYDPPTRTEATADKNAIIAQGDAAWTTGSANVAPELLHTTTISALESQTKFTLGSGSADDDAYNGHVIIITDQSTATQKAVGFISDYTGANTTVVLKKDPGIFTMAIGDTIHIVVGENKAGGALTKTEFLALD